MFFDENDLNSTSKKRVSEKQNKCRHFLERTIPYCHAFISWLGGFRAYLFTVVIRK